MYCSHVKFSWLFRRLNYRCLVFHDERQCCRGLCDLEWHLIRAVVAVTVAGRDSRERAQIQNVVDKDTPGGKGSLRLEDDRGLAGPIRRAESRMSNPGIY